MYSIIDYILNTIRPETYFLLIFVPEAAVGTRRSAKVSYISSMYLQK